jgi:hypothetical protein
MDMDILAEGWRMKNWMILCAGDRYPGKPDARLFECKELLQDAFKDNGLSDGIF